jgi:hydroxypyruvate reductase
VTTTAPAAIDDAHAAWRAALIAADPARAIARAVPALRRAPSRVIALGKAGAAMALGVREHLPFPPAPAGLVVVPYGHGADVPGCELIEAGHPIPDGAGQRAARRIAALLDAAGPEDAILVLLSGGGSALLADPLPGLSLAAVAELTRALLASGAAIGEINCVRRHLLSLGGGRMAARTAATLDTWVLSDVPGDALFDIASGPTVADPTTFADVDTVLKHRAIRVPPPIESFVAAGQRGEQPETLKPGDPRLARSTARIIGSGAMSLVAAADTLRAAGWTVENAGDAISGDAMALAADIATAVRRLRSLGRRRVALISGGEAQVPVGDAAGRGGRNSTFALALLAELGEEPGVSALAADTDGLDGTGPHAGAWFVPGDLAVARARGLDPDAALSAHDSYGFFARLDRALVTGPTRTNVNDFRVVLVE